MMVMLRDLDFEWTIIKQKQVKAKHDINVDLFLLDNER